MGKLAPGPEKARTIIEYNRFFLLWSRNQISKPNIWQESTYVKSSEHKVDVFLWVQRLSSAEFVFPGQTGRQVLKYSGKSLQSKENNLSPCIWCFHCNKTQQTVCFLWNIFLQTETLSLIIYLNHLSWLWIKLWVCHLDTICNHLLLWDANEIDLSPLYNS